MNSKPTKVVEHTDALNAPAAGITVVGAGTAVHQIAMWWDGGERAITAREKARIEEHSPSCFTIPLVPVVPAACCGSCGDVIRPDELTGTTCRCAEAGEAAEQHRPLEMRLRLEAIAYTLLSEKSLPALLREAADALRDGPEGFVVAPLEPTDAQVAHGELQVQAVLDALGTNARPQTLAMVAYDGMIAARPAAVTLSSVKPPRYPHVQIPKEER